MLADSEIKKLLESGDLVIDPYPEDHQIQPASVDLKFDSIHPDFLDIPSFKKDSYIFPPGRLRIGSTIEYIKLPPTLAARVEGRSSWGRKGLAIHITAGFIDPGFEGNITLEMINLSTFQLQVSRGNRICQVCFIPIIGNVERSYGSKTIGSKYQGQVGPTLSKEDII